MFHPWRFVGQFPHIRVHHEDLGNVSGRSDGVANIWLHKDLRQVERRCTLTHELFHIAEGHTSRVPFMLELCVRFKAARALVSLEELARGLAWAMSAEELADELGVTERIVMDRLASLTDDERLVLHEVELQTM